MVSTDKLPQPTKQETQDTVAGGRYNETNETVTNQKASSSYPLSSDKHRRAKLVVSPVPPARISLVTHGALTESTQISLSSASSALPSCTHVLSKEKNLMSRVDDYEHDESRSASSHLAFHMFTQDSVDSLHPDLPTSESLTLDLHAVVQSTKNNDIQKRRIMLKRKSSLLGEADERGSNSLGVSSKKNKSRTTMAGDGPVSLLSHSRDVFLSRPNDAAVLSPLHVFIRRQIEVFTATLADTQQPAPGRKNPIQLEQIGLRCIHCRNLPAKDRVKRALCFPSSVGRIYHSVSDMKFDHFPACKGFNGKVREEFERLKVEDKKREKKQKFAKCRDTAHSSSTAQYYHDAAIQMGMNDAKGGVFFSLNPPVDGATTTNQLSSSQLGGKASSTTQAKDGYNETAQHPPPLFGDILSHGLTASCPPLFQAQQHRSPSLDYIQRIAAPQSLLFGFLVQQDIYNRSLQNQLLLSMISKNNKHGTWNDYYLQFPKSPAIEGDAESKPLSPASTTTTGMILAAPADSKYLNPIHCFVRRHVEFFVANKDDVSAPAPGRKTRIQIGQVGIRCVHCSKLPFKERVKRAFCYPQAVGGIYHAVSNMKFDHFSNCRGLSPVDRAEFERLRSDRARRGGGGSGGGGALTCTSTPKGAVANSTAQYYHDSAHRMGLVDTSGGIRLMDHSRSTRGLVGLEHLTPAAASGDTSDGISALYLAAAAGQRS
ncbi:hypothetical protein ACA910_019937 [Epithemia clementina (nom. ined.)]